MSNVIQQKYHNDNKYKNKVLNATRQKYRNSKSDYRQKLLRLGKEKYLKDPLYRMYLIAYAKTRYAKQQKFKKQLLQKILQNHASESLLASKQQPVKETNNENRVIFTKFLEKIAEGPTYDCAVCSRLLFPSQAKKCNFETFKQKEDVWLVARKCIFDVHNYNEEK